MNTDPISITPGSSESPLEEPDILLVLSCCSSNLRKFYLNYFPHLLYVCSNSLLQQTYTVKHPSFVYEFWQKQQDFLKNNQDIKNEEVLRHCVNHNSNVVI